MEDLSLLNRSRMLKLSMAFKKLFFLWVLYIYWTLLLDLCSLCLLTYNTISVVSSMTPLLNN